MPAYCIDFTSGLIDYLLLPFLLLTLPVSLSRSTNAASSPRASALYIVRLRSAPPVASYRGGFAGYPATAVWDSDPNGTTPAGASDDEARNGVGAASVASNAGVATASLTPAATAAAAAAAAATAATTSGSGGTSRRARRPRLNVRAPGVRAFKQLLQRMQQAVLRDSGVDVGKMLYSYVHTDNSFTAALTAAQVQRMRRHPSVASTLPAGWAGTCPTTSDFTCNNKIIGGGIFHAGFESEYGGQGPGDDEWASPRDSDGHGTWCAGAAAGNSGVEVPGEGTISGVAPRARLAIYKVYWYLGGPGESITTNADVFAAVDQAVADGVDVLTLSLDNTHRNTAWDEFDVGKWTYFDDVPFLGALAAGVTVALAVGDEGRPFYRYLNPSSPAIDNFAPYYISVGAR
ncbi:unnamed protein product [Closterium sp. Yama58-4]|nr:unnamed protein product [Closterium sp. Yama58-4]